MTTETTTKKRTTKATTTPVNQPVLDELIQEQHLSHDVTRQDDHDEISQVHPDEMTDAARARLQAILSQLTYVKSAFASSRRQLGFIVRWAEKLERDLSVQLLAEVKTSIATYAETPTPVYWYAINDALGRLEDSLEAQLAD